MIPANHPMWEKLVTGQVQHKFVTASAGMLFFNLALTYKRDPTKLPQLLAEARAFFTKYERILNDDTRALFK